MQAVSMKKGTHQDLSKAKWQTRGRPSHPPYLAPHERFLGLRPIVLQICSSSTHFSGKRVNQDLVTPAVLSSAHWGVSMLRPILFVWVLILVPKTCLWAQDTSPGNAQGCDPRELTVLLRPTDS